MRGKRRSEKLQQESKLLVAVFFFLLAVVSNLWPIYQKRIKNPTGNDNSNINQTNHSDSYCCRCHLLLDFIFLFDFAPCAFFRLSSWLFLLFRCIAANACPIQASKKSLQLICILPMFKFGFVFLLFLLFCVSHSSFPLSGLLLQLCTLFAIRFLLFSPDFLFFGGCLCVF